MISIMHESKLPLGLKLCLFALFLGEDNFSRTCNVVLHEKDRPPPWLTSSSCISCQREATEETKTPNILYLRNSSIGCIIKLMPELKSQSIISLISSRAGLLMHRMLDRPDILQLQFSREMCSLERISMYQKLYACSSWTADQTNVLVAFIKFTRRNRFAVLRSESFCYDHILQSILSHFNPTNSSIAMEQIAWQVFTFSEESFAPFQYLNLLAKVKAHSDNVVLLMTALSNVEIVFRTAQAHGLLGYGYAWVYVGQWKEIDGDMPVPMQLLKVQRSLIQSVAESTPKNLVRMVAFANKSCEQVSHLETSIQHKVSAHQHVREAFDRFSKVEDCYTDVTSKTELAIRQDRKWVPLMQQSGSQEIRYFPEIYKHYLLFKSKVFQETLQVVTILDPPFTMEAPYLYPGKTKNSCYRGVVCHVPVFPATGDEPSYRVTCCIGYAIDLLQLIASNFDMSYHLYVVADGYYGAFVDGKWNGMIGDIVNRKADFAIAGLTISKERMSVVDFTAPFMQSDIGIVTRVSTDDNLFINWKFLQPLEEDVIWGVCIIFIVGTVLMYFLENQEVAFKRILNPILNPPKYRCREGFTYFSGLTFQRDLGGKNPKRFSARVTAIIFAFAMVIVMTTYTAILTATNVHRNDEKTFLGLHDKRMTNPTSDFKFATARHTSIEMFFKNAPDPTLNGMYRAMLRYNVKSVAEGLGKVVNGELQAFINEYAFLLYHISRQTTCVLTIQRTPIMQLGFGIALHKESKLKHSISNLILKLKENGYLAELNAKWLAKGCASKNAEFEIVPDSLSISYFGGLVLALACCLILAFVLLILESVYFMYHRVPIDAVVQAAIDYHEKKRQKKLRRLSLTAKPKLKSFRTIGEGQDTRL